MTDILVTSPYQPFTLPTQFKAVFNGYIYCGTVDAVDPSVSQVQVYLVNESGDKVPVAQPLRTNAGGFLVYNGQPAKFVTNSNHSLLVRDSLGTQLWYAPNMAEIDPAAASFLAIEALRRSYAEAGFNLVVGSFEAGGTLTSASDVLLQESSGKAFGWAGAFPKVVSAGSGVAGFVDKSETLLRPLSFFKRAGVSSAIEKSLKDLAVGSAISLLEIGKDDGVFDNGPAINTAAILGKSIYIPNPTVSWNISTPVVLPEGFRIFGEDMLRTLITVGADVTPFTVGLYSKISEIRIAKKAGVSSTKSGIDIGTPTLSGARSTVERVFVERMGLDGITVRNGNLGTIKDVICISNTGDGIRFTKETPDNNSWKLEGFIDVRSNGRDGIHVEEGASTSDPFASKTHSMDLVVAQQNTRYGVFLGTRNNNIVLYSEANGVADLYISPLSGGNNIVLVEGQKIVDASNGSSNISVNNFSADYRRGFKNQLLLSGKANKGLRISNDDEKPGFLKLEKIGQTSFAFKFGGSDAVQDFSFLNEQPYNVNVSFGGVVYPSTDQSHSLGYSSKRWSTVFAATGTINTSDEREKTAPLPIDDLVLDAWEDVSLVSFKWLQSIEQKGDLARTHFGLIAQQVRDAFLARGLDGTEYGMLCFDEWGDKFEEVMDESGKITQNLVVCAGERWGVRPDQCLFLEAALQRRNYRRLLARDEVLEG